MHANAEAERRAMQEKRAGHALTLNTVAAVQTSPIEHGVLEAWAARSADQIVQQIRL
jgi:hypothetical protein